MMTKTINKKIISIPLGITQDDIDYLKRRACECLCLFHKEKNIEEKKRLWILFDAYNGFYETNKNRAVKIEQ